MSVKSVLGHELAGDLLCELRLQASFFVDMGELLPLLDRSLAKRAPLAHEVSGLGVGLRADGHIFARRHRHCARRPSGDRRRQDFGPPTRGRGDAHDETRGRNDPVVGAEDGRPQPGGPVDVVRFRSRHCADPLVRSLIMVK